LNAQRPGTANDVHFTDLWPFPAAEAEQSLRQAKRLVALENNATAQLATLLRSQTGIEMDDRLLKYDGRAFSPEVIVARVREEM
jgi:2-oxoglutarate ferredoxin oxidoreductase subunit alpha